MTSFFASLFAQHKHMMNILVHNAHITNALAKSVVCLLSPEFKKRSKPQQRLS